MTFKYERWKSEDNQEEVHYFVAGKQNEYVIGYNPKYLPRELIEGILDKLCESPSVIE